jgi:hypothetical protein
MGNPHFPWWGALRLHQVHITVPVEKYDVMGATLLGVPLPLIGFNAAWAGPTPSPPTTASPCATWRWTRPTRRAT